MYNRQPSGEVTCIRMYATLVHSQLWYYYSACRRRLYFIDKERAKEGEDVRHVCIIISYKHFIFSHSFHEDLSLTSFSKQGNTDARELVSYHYRNWTRVTWWHEQSKKIWSKRRFSIVRRQFKILFIENTKKSTIGMTTSEEFLEAFYVRVIDRNTPVTLRKYCISKHRKTRVEYLVVNKVKLYQMSFLV